MCEVAFLADHLEVVPTLAHWFRTQWPDYFAGKTLAAIEEDFYAEANRQNIPVRLLAFVRDNMAGTIVLRERALRVLSVYTPGLGGLYVAEQYRLCGIGTELVKAGIKVAQRQGYENIFAGTSTAKSLFERLGWEPIMKVWEEQEQVVLYRYELRGE